MWDVEDGFEQFHHESVFLEVKEDLSGSFMMEGSIIFGVDSHVIHVDLQPFFLDVVGEDVIHEHLESGWGIAEPEEHHGGFR